MTSATKKMNKLKTNTGFHVGISVPWPSLNCTSLKTVTAKSELITIEVATRAACDGEKALRSFALNDLCGLRYLCDRGCVLVALPATSKDFTIANFASHAYAVLLRRGR